MEFGVYESGLNYLVAELRGGNPIRGLLVDKAGGRLLDDIESFSTNEVRIGSLRLNLMATARLAAKSRFLAKVRNGVIVEQMADLDYDDDWLEYVGE